MGRRQRKFERAHRLAYLFGERPPERIAPGLRTKVAAAKRLMARSNREVRSGR